MDNEQLSQLAMSLRDNEAFQMALDNRRKEALEGLVSVSATDTNAIHSYQATVKVVDELRADLDGFIRAGQARRKPGVA